ncbi:MAG: protein TolQ [Deltaproteobacteria bacterium]|nr:MAG: protein TolQ [Deltaproteobacteria bacterium]
MILKAGLVVKAVLLILFLMSIVCWGSIIRKYFVIRKSQEKSRDFRDNFWQGKKITEVYQATKPLSESHLAEIFRIGFFELNRLYKTYKKENKLMIPDDLSIQMGWIDNINRTLRSAQMGEMQRLERGVPFLATTGNTAPFIGLFGTVWGIMTSFQEIGLKGAANLAVVAPGISEALVATAAGLFAAIPAVVAYNHFVNKLRFVETEMLNFSTDFLNLIKRDFFKQASVHEAKEFLGGAAKTK